VSPDAEGKGGHFCSHCDHPTAIVRVSYTVNDTLYIGVPVRVCLNVECVKKAGASTFKSRHLTKPAGIYRGD
jgi:hypothetical protein